MPMRFNFGFFMREALKNVRSNLLMSITAITTTFICIVVLGVAWLVSAHVGGLTASVRQDVSVEAYFPPDATQEEIDAIISDVEGWPEVSGVNYVSEEEALASFKETFADRPELYENLDPGVLPASIQIQLEDPSEAEAVAQRLEQEQGFSDQNLSYPSRLSSVSTRSPRT